MPAALLSSQIAAPFEFCGLCPLAICSANLLHRCDEETPHNTQPIAIKATKMIFYVMAIPYVDLISLFVLTGERVRCGHNCI
jgi:hypothetical protein